MPRPLPHFVSAPRPLTVLCSSPAGTWATAAVLVLGLRVAAAGVVVRRKTAGGEERERSAAGGAGAGAGPGGQQAASLGACSSGKQPGVAPRAPPRRGESILSTPGGGPPGGAGSWRAAVGDDAVADAWEAFAGAIVQEFIYDAWWSYLSPDTAFPAEVRRLLHDAFGGGAARARSARHDWGAALLR